MIKKIKMNFFLIPFILLSSIFSTMFSLLIVAENGNGSNGGDFPYALVLTLIGVLLMGAATLILLKRRR